MSNIKRKENFLQSTPCINIKWFDIVDWIMKMTTTGARIWYNKIMKKADTLLQRCPILFDVQFKAREDWKPIETR